ncbi:Malonate--CoA ligase [Apostasia shenzhenica]|uniref:4-coumarate--CoA ligase n=1 Tax=Apostasia shenzhenica TaxID=1088818 RepID=A0A2I0AZT0_9ASPA|nr:Malonate--CoA ligase [Apostasia shenzhenica]
MEVVKSTIQRASAAHDSVALRAESYSYSYLQLFLSAWNISEYLCDRIDNVASENGKSAETNKKPKHLHGARVGVVAKPSAEFVAGMLGTWLSGGVAVPLALSYPETELLHVMNDSDISVVLSSEENRELMEKVATKCSSDFHLLPSVTSVRQKTDLLVPAEKEEFHSISKLAAEMSDDPALVLYTSGTTGKPKGVVHTHKGIISQVQILAEAWEYRCSDQFLHCLPLHHIQSECFCCKNILYSVEFMPKFSVRGVWQRWRESYPSDGSKVDSTITLFTGVPTMYTRLLQGYEAMDQDHKEASALAARQLRLMMCGSSALPYPVMKQWENITGHRLLERYGMTEFVMALSNPLNGFRKAGTVGKPLPRVEVKIIGDDGNTIDGVGELCVRSPSLFKEYWKQPKVTEESFIEGGFFKTGDTVTVDEDGYYVILGRSNADIMKVGGYKLSALEIEAVILEASVLECSVLGLQDKDYGEIVCAVIVLHKDIKKVSDQELKQAFSLEELQNWSKERLAPYKVYS